MESERQQMVFRKFRELGSARQVLLWAKHAELTLPVVRRGPVGARIEGQSPVYHRIISILQHPMYAGAYVWQNRQPHRGGAGRCSNACRTRRGNRYWVWPASTRRIRRGCSARVSARVCPVTRRRSGGCRAASGRDAHSGRSADPGALLSSAREKKVWWRSRARIQRSTTCTPTSALALPRAIDYSP